MAIVPDRLLPVLLPGDARPGSLPADRSPVRVRVLTLVGQHRPGLHARNRTRQLRTVRTQGRGQTDHDGMAEGVDDSVDLRGESATTTPQRLGRLTATPIRFFLAPAAAPVARTQLLSTHSHSVSPSRNSAATFRQTPILHQRS